MGDLYQCLSRGSVQIKRIEVKPGRRTVPAKCITTAAKHWIVVQGMARVTNSNGSGLVNITRVPTFIPRRP